MIAAPLAAFAATDTQRDSVVLAVSAAVGLSLLAGGALFRRSSVITAAIMLIAATYITRLIANDAALDSLAPPFAGLLILAAEIANDTTRSRERLAADPGTDLGAIARTVPALLVGVLIATLAMIAASSRQNETLALIAVGAACAVAAIMLAAHHIGVLGRPRVPRRARALASLSPAHFAGRRRV